MNIKKISKRDKKKLKELAGIAYEKDLSRCLDVIYGSFENWKSGEMSVWDLNQHIHEFHNEIARSLYKSYTMTDTIFSVAFGIKQGVIDIDDVPANVKSDVEKLLNAFQKVQLENQ